MIHLWFWNIFCFTFFFLQIIHYGFETYNQWSEFDQLFSVSCYTNTTNAFTTHKCIEFFREWFSHCWLFNCASRVMTNWEYLKRELHTFFVTSIVNKWNLLSDSSKKQTTFEIIALVIANIFRLYFKGIIRVVTIHIWINNYLILLSNNKNRTQKINDLTTLGSKNNKDLGTSFNL